MASHSFHAVGGRVPLGDGASRANVQPSDRKTPSRPIRVSKSSSITPNESVIHHNASDLRHSMVSPKHKRISAVVEDQDEGSKRNSAVSSTSTNASGGARRRKTHIGPWQLGQTIGKGGTSRVRKVRHVVTGEPAVAKIIPKAVADKNRSLSLANLVKCAELGDPSLASTKVIPFGLEREIVIMKLLTHRNIVRLFDVWENRNELYLIMEYVEGGDLFEYVAQQHRLDEREAVYLFRQIIAALLYCHRIRIHHRDLKPENILLDLNTLEVKLVDFGMAALQPQGGLLTTPCGSPHYAAPEVIAIKAYDGSKADVWSCGVILFVLLTGYPPFNFPPDPHNKMSEDKKLKSLFQTICRAEYKLPSSLSVEARDLISRIFVAEPGNRISIEQMWHHPLLHKYDVEFDLTGTTLEASIGPGPTIENWKQLTIKSIDREIFRNLRTLWHSQKEDVLVQRLLSEEPNQEKYFYSALLKYREENLENMVYAPGVVECSASDYQHAKPATSWDKVPSITISKTSHLRSKSQYSVLNNEHLYSRHSFFENPSEASYDPFRSSREPIVSGGNEYMNVTVHRGTSNGSKRLKPQLSTSRQPSSLRIEAIRRSSRRGSGLSITSRSTRLSASHRSSMSRSSIHSGKWHDSPQIIVSRPTSLHKRPVKFSHLHKTSTTNAPVGKTLLNSAAITPDKRRNGVPARYRAGGNLPTPKAQPPPAQKGQSQKCSNQVEPTPRTRKMKDIEQEARKVSTELEKVCEEAFYRSSISSSIQSSSILDKPSPFSDTPPSSVSQPSERTKLKTHLLDMADFANRPLPPIPASKGSPLANTETPRTYTARELVELRERLAKTYAEKGVSSEKAFNDLLTQLDNLLPLDSRKSIESSGSQSGTHPQPDGYSPLQVIPEEGRFANSDQGISSYERYTHQTPRVGHNRAMDQGNGHTIRDVPASSPPSPPSPCPVAPLNIRKRSDKCAAIPNSKPVGKSMNASIEIYDEGLSYSSATTSSGPVDNPLTTVTDKSRLTPTPPNSKRPSWWKRDDVKHPNVKTTKTGPGNLYPDHRTAEQGEAASWPSQTTPVERSRLRERGVEPPLDNSHLLNVRLGYHITEPSPEKRGFFAFFRKKVEHVYKLKGTSILSCCAGRMNWEPF